MIRDLSLTCDLCGRTVRHICENGVVAETIDQQIIRSLKVERDALKAEVERLTAALADRDRRIEAALSRCQGTVFAGCARSLRGESDE